MVFPKEKEDNEFKYFEELDDKIKKEKEWPKMIGDWIKIAVGIGTIIGMVFGVYVYAKNADNPDIQKNYAIKETSKKVENLSIKVERMETKNEEEIEKLKTEVNDMKVNFATVKGDIKEIKKILEIISKKL